MYADATDLASVVSALSTFFTTTGRKCLKVVGLTTFLPLPFSVLATCGETASLKMERAV